MREGRTERGKEGTGERGGLESTFLGQKGWVAAAKSWVKGEDENEGGRRKETGVRAEEEEE